MSRSFDSPGWDGAAGLVRSADAGAGLTEAVINKCFAGLGRLIGRDFCRTVRKRTSLRWPEMYPGTAQPNYLCVPPQFTGAAFFRLNTPTASPRRLLVPIILVREVIFVTYPECCGCHRVGMTRRKAADRQIIMSVPQVAARWSVSAGEVLDLCVRGGLPHHRIGDLIRIRFRDIEAFEERQREPGSAPPRRS